MSKGELERRLQGLRPAAPRPALREDVLGAVREELERSQEASFDRFLARPAPWIAVAALLALLLGANLLLERDAAKARAGRRAAIEADGRSLVEYRVWLARWTAGGGR